jgi:hypothetical protein
LIARVAALAFPKKVGTAFWIDIKGKKDTGLSFEIVRHKAISLDALIGKIGAGVAAHHQITQVGPVTVSVGLGAITPYSDFLSEIRPIASVRIKF